MGRNTRGKAGRKCTVCQHPEVAEINKLLASGVSHAEIARRFGLGRRSVARHAAHHLPATVVAAAKKDQEAQALDVLGEVKKLYHVALDLLGKAAKAEDLRTALAGVGEARKNLELLGKLLGQLDERPQVNILVSQQWAEVRTRLLNALEPFPEARVAAARALQEVGDGHSG